MTAVGDRLRRAAGLIERCAEGTTPAPWSGYVQVEEHRAEMFAGPQENGYLTGSVFAFCEEAVEEYGGMPSAEDMRWMSLMNPEVAEQLVLWLRSEAIQFETSERRGSPYGYPSWHFASVLLGKNPSDGGFTTLPLPEAVEE
jgi:hypothetical protein